MGTSTRLSFEDHEKTYHLPTTAKYNCPHCPYEVQEIHESNFKRHLNDQHKYKFKTIKLEAYCRDKKKDEKDDTEDEKDDTAIMITVFFLIMITVVFASFAWSCQNKTTRQML